MLIDEGNIELQKPMLKDVILDATFWETYNAVLARGDLSSIAVKVSCPKACLSFPRRCRLKLLLSLSTGFDAEMHNSERQELVWQ